MQDAQQDPRQDRSHPEPSRPTRRADATSLAGTRALYRWQAPIYDLTRWAFLRGRGAAVRKLRLRAGQSALEVGCGTGGNLLRLRHLVGEAGEVHGIDLSPHMLERARPKLARRGWQNIHLHELDAGDFDLGRRFDGILYSYSLGMIPQWRRSLESAARHLAPGGRLAVVDFGSLDGCRVLRRPLLRWLRAHHVDPERPCAAALGQIFAGGSVEIEHGVGNWHFLAGCTKSGR